VSDDGITAGNQVGNELAFKRIRGKSLEKVGSGIRSGRLKSSRKAEGRRRKTKTDRTLDVARGENREACERKRWGGGGTIKVTIPPLGGVEEGV